MFLIRQSYPEDADQILEVAKHLDTVNLPADADHIERIVDLSVRSFGQTVPASEREYLFVLEDRAAKRVIGTSMIHAQHGSRREPHVYFQILKDERYSQTLDRYFKHQCLRLNYNYDGPTEIGGLILLPDYRGHEQALGKMLSYVRFLFIAMKRDVFRDRVLSELLPPLEADGTSILWEHLGRRFTGLSYQEADLESKHNKEFIKALFPHSLIYTSLLPESVRNAIGEVGPETKGVEKILRRIGFEYANQIDPFDGGPHFLARTDDITLVKDSRDVTVTSAASADRARPWAIIATEIDGAFRATSARVIPSADGETLGITSGTRALLGVEPGDKVWKVVS